MKKKKKLWKMAEKIEEKKNQANIFADRRIKQRINEIQENRSKAIG